MNADNQTAYWDKVASQKTFGHPLNINLLSKYISPTAHIVDFGCGYGLLVKELTSAGYPNIVGYDSSLQLINRGKKEESVPLVHISSPEDLPVADNSTDCILLFAVLTCIPSNKGQQDLIKLLRSKLKVGSIVYISDYYLQHNEISQSRYTYLNDDTNNYGVFTLPEGAIFRHHTREWVNSLLKDFEINEEHIIEVKTMNGNNAEAFQLIASKSAN